MDAGRIQRELPESTVVVWSCDPRHFEFSVNSKAYIGSDALIVTRNLNEVEIRESFSNHFESIERLPAITVSNGGHPSFEVSVYRAGKMRSVPKAPHTPE